MVYEHGADSYFTNVLYYRAVENRMSGCFYRPYRKNDTDDIFQYKLLFCKNAQCSYFNLHVYYNFSEKALYDINFTFKTFY